MSEEIDKVWKKFLKKHWKMLSLFILLAIIAFVGAVYVFLWFVGEAQVTGLVPSILSGWALEHIITFLLHLIFWELLYIAIPALIVIAVIYFGWWKKLPYKEQKEYRDEHLFGKKTHKSDAGGIFSFLIFIAFCVKIYHDGNWSVPIATWKFDYLVNSCIMALIWMAIIIGIPVLIGGTLWLFYQIKK